MTEPIRVLELRSVRGTGGGPEKTILTSAATSDPRRFAVTVCYLRDLRDDTFSVDATAAALPVNYVEIRERHSFDPSIWPALRALVRDHRIQIVHAHDYKTNALARALALAEPVVTLSTVHGWTGHSRRERLIYYPLDKKLLAGFPQLIAVSGEIRDELVRHGAQPSRIATVLNGIDHRAFHRDRDRQSDIRRQLRLSTDDIVIAGVGRLEPQKRFDLLMSAFARLRAARPALRLVIAGDGSVRDALASQIAELGLGDSCRLLGHRTDVADLHHAFDVFVQSSDYEGTSNAVLEAMALETPIVATDVGGTAEMVRPGIDGLIVNPGDDALLAQAITETLALADRTRCRVAAARLRVENELSFDARMRTIEHIYEQLVATGMSRGTSRAAA